MKPFRSKVIGIFLAAVMIMSLLLGCLFTDVSVDLNMLNEAAATLTLPDKTDTDLVFPKLEEKYSSIKLSYSSSNTSVVSNNGSVSRLSADTIVTITAKLTLNKSVVEKPFEITVLGTDNDITEQITIDLESAVLSQDVKASEVDVLLNLSGSVEPKGGLRLKASYEGGNGVLSDFYDNEASEEGNFSFNLSISKYSAMPHMKLDLNLEIARESLDTIYVPFPTENINSDIVYGIKQNASLINAYNFGIENGVLSIVTNGAIISEHLSGKIKVLSDAMRLKTQYTPLLNLLTANIVLPATAETYNSEINWSSGNDSVITSGGNITRSAVNTSTTLTATLTNGGENFVVILPVSVAAAFTGVELYETLGNQSKLFTKNSSNLSFSGSSVSGTTIDADPTQTYNDIEGFGGCMTHGSAYLIYNSSYKLQLIKELFSPNYANFSVVRLPIGSSDFPTYVGSTYDSNGVQTYKGTLKNFTLCDSESPAPNRLNSFSINIDKQELIPVIKLALQENPDLVFMGSPWSAPAWMKDSNSLLYGTLKQSEESLYADYLVKYLLAYKEEGIDIKYITLQNEPGHESGVHPTMLMSASQQARIIKLLAPKLLDNNLQTKIIMLDHNTDMLSYVQTVLNDSTARQYVDGVGFHGYDGEIEQLASIISSINASYPEINFYFTEMTAGSTYTDFSGNMIWALKNIIAGSVNNKVKFVMYFNFVLDENGMPFIRTDWLGQDYHCVGLIELPSNGNMYKLNPEFYALKHYSRFSAKFNGILAKRIKTTYSNSDLIVSGILQADGKASVTIVNTSGSSQTVTLRYNSTTLTQSLAANSVSTFVWYLN